MDYPYWHKQTIAQPLFPSLVWSRPENRQFAGKLLVIAGNLYGFAAAGEAFSAAQAAGIGVTRVLLPDALQKFIGKTMEAEEYAPSTPSGSLSQKALGELLLLSHWSDGVLIAGDLGRNSETAILLEKYIEAWNGQLVLTKDGADYAISAPQSLLNRPQTTLVVSIAQLQRFAINARYSQAFTFGMDLIRLVETLHSLTERYAVAIIVKHLQTILTAVNGEVSTTRLETDIDIWRVQAAAYATVWLIQNPTRAHAALATAIHEFLHSTA